MDFTENQLEKLGQAEEILKALGLPKTQYNRRSCWVFLALASVRPSEPWSSATPSLYTTAALMEFISTEYGMTYKPNSRESVRRGTLHQFEQARLIDRNRDKPERATNSGNNNYSLNEPVIEILKAYPNGDWKEKIAAFKELLPDLKSQYERKLDLNKISIRLPDGREAKLSPGKHNQLHADILHEFCARFIGSPGKLCYLGDTGSSRKEGGKLMILEAEFLESLGIPPMSHEKLPDVVVYDQKRKWLFLIEAVTSHGPVSPKRWIELEAAFKDCTVGRVYVSAFPSRAIFRKHVGDIAWETEIWIADSPDHMIHFNGDRFLGPHDNSL